MPNVGETKIKFGRRYMFLNVDPFQGPGTWRLSVPDTYPGGGGGGSVNITGVAPINSTVDVNGNTEISMDIRPLNNREDTP